MGRDRYVIALISWLNLNFCSRSLFPTAIESIVEEALGHRRCSRSRTHGRHRFDHGSSHKGTGNCIRNEGNGISVDPRN